MPYDYGALEPYIKYVRAVPAPTDHSFSRNWAARNLYPRLRMHAWAAPWPRHTAIHTHTPVYCTRLLHSARIMELHHTKHHAAYVANLNAALEKYEAAEKAGDLATCLSLQAALKFNGGGHINHSIFWTNLAPPSAGGGGEPEGELANRIKQQWGDFQVCAPQCAHG